MMTQRFLTTIFHLGISYNRPAKCFMKPFYEDVDELLMDRMFEKG